jgi:hypothetical protein
MWVFLRAEKGFDGAAEVLESCGFSVYFKNISCPLGQNPSIKGKKFGIWCSSPLSFPKFFHFPVKIFEEVSEVGGPMAAG